MSNGYTEALRALKKLETQEAPTTKTIETGKTIHKTSSSAYEETKNLKTPKRQATKTTETRPVKSRRPKDTARKTTKTPKTDELGLIASWSHEFGYVSLHDPVSGVWHDLAVKDAPGWAPWESRKRQELYRAGDYRAYRLSARQMEEIWEAEHPPDMDLIEEEHPIEEDLD